MDLVNASAHFSNPAKPVSFQVSEIEVFTRILGLVHPKLEYNVNSTILHFPESCLLISYENNRWPLQILCETEQGKNNK